MSETVAAIDCGTNTIKLLVGALPEVAVRETRIVRLGQGVDATGRLADEALARTFEALDEYAALIREHGVTRIRFCATSATRDAENAAVFTEGVRERLGVTPDVLSGAEEAELAYDGAVRHLRDEPALPVLVVDIGGGSTELILGASLTAPPSAAHSMDIGSVRLHERHLRSDPPTAAEVTACVADIDRHLDACPVSPARARPWSGWPGPSRRWRPACSTCRPTTATRSTRRCCRSTRCTRWRTAWWGCPSPSDWRCRGCTPAAPT